MKVRDEIFIANETLRANQNHHIMCNNNCINIINIFTQNKHQSEKHSHLYLLMLYNTVRYRSKWNHYSATIIIMNDKEYVNNVANIAQSGLLFVESYRNSNYYNKNVSEIVLYTNSTCVPILHMIGLNVVWLANCCSMKILCLTCFIIIPMMTR